MSARPCSTCTKPVYPKEKIAISDCWFHTGCLKCSVCSSTLSLNSVYVSVASGEKRIYCKVDVPRAIHTAVVDSVALRRALSAPKADNPGPKALRTGSMRFKGLTLRSKGMRGGMEAPKLGVVAGTGAQVVVGMVKGSTLDSWDIQHAMEVQSFASSLLTPHPAIQAQRTGSSTGNSFVSPSILLPQQTGNSNGNSTLIVEGEEEIGDGIAREMKGQKEPMPMEKNLVRNLLRAFQLSSLEVVALPSPSPSSPSPSLSLVPSSSTTTSTGPGTASTLKLPSHALTDLTSVQTLGTRSRLHASPSKPSLQSMFDAPNIEPTPESPKKTVRISDKVPSIIAAFAPGSGLAADEEDAEEESEGWDGEGEDGGMGEDEMLRRMEEVGLEVVMVYEEDVGAEEGEGEKEKD